MKIKTQLLSLLIVAGSISFAGAQDLKEKDVSTAAKQAFVKIYPTAQKVSWEKEKGNFEANWGGQSGEDTSVAFTPSGKFVEMVVAIPITELPGSIELYIKHHYNNAKIIAAGKVTNSAGKHLFEAEIKGKDILFNEMGGFIKKD